MTKRTIDDARKIIFELYPSIEILNNNYKDENTLMKLRCNECGNEWESRFYNLTLCGCSVCNEIKRNAEKLIEIKKLTLERYNIEILSKEYFGANKKLKFKCRTCNHEWYATYNNIRDNGTCENCNTINRNKKNFEKLKNKIYKINPDIEVLNDIYYGRNTLLKFKCNTCDYEWERKFNNFTRYESSSKCPRCNKTERLDIEILKDRMSEINPDIEILSTEYINTKTHLDCKCKVCNYEWKMTPSNLQKERGCPVCKKRKKYTLQEVKDELHEINPNIEILSDVYIDKHSGLDLKCNACNYEWKATAHSLIYAKNGCPSCSGHLRHTQEDIVKKMYEVNPNLEVIGEYTTIDQKLKMRCKICNNEWEAKAYHLVTGASGCPQCASSKGEERIYKYLSENNIIHQKQYVYDDLVGINGGKLKFDFAITNDRGDVLLQIEYQGEQHYKYVKYFGGNEGFAERVYHDALKQAYCQDNNIPLLIIPFWDFNNIEQILNNTIREYITDLPPNTDKSTVNT